MKILLFANTDWYLYNFRRSLAQRLVEDGYEVVLLSPSGEYGSKLLGLGFNWIPAPLNRISLNPIRELFFVYWLYRFLKKNKIDIIHGFTIKCAVYGSLAARFAGVHRRINAVAGMGYVFTSKDAKASLLRPIVRLLMRIALGGDLARLILQNSDDVKLFNEAKIVNPDYIRLIPSSGVDCSRFHPKYKFYSDSGVNKIKVVLASRLLWDKGVSEYVAAARSLLAEGYEIDFILAGDPDLGNPAAVPVDTIKGWVSEGLIKWLGHVDDMPSLFQSADIVVLPSYREGLPKGLIEAGACGVPLVTTDVPGCREVVTDGINGLLVPVKDAGRLACAIANLAVDPQLRHKLGSAARARALSEFDERIVISNTLSVYKEIFRA